MSGADTNFDAANGVTGGDPVQDRRGWHLDKGLNPAYIIPLLGAILTGLAWAGTVNSEQVDQNRRIGTVEKRMDESITTNREDLKEINRKLDRLIERGK